MVVRDASHMCSNACRCDCKSYVLGCVWVGVVVSRRCLMQLGGDAIGR